MPLSCAPQKITERVLVHEKKANPVHVHTPSTLMRAGYGATQRENLTVLRSEGSSGPETDPAVTLSVRRRRSSLARAASVLVITDDSDHCSGSSCVRSDAAVVRDLIYIDS